jgi:hypothetical protein
MKVTTDRALKPSALAQAVAVVSRQRARGAIIALSNDITIRGGRMTVEGSPVLLREVCLAGHGVVVGGQRFPRTATLIQRRRSR